MRQIKEVLRLKHDHQLSIRQIARSCGLPSSTVNDYLVRAQAAGLSWPLPEGLDDQQIQQKLLTASPAPLEPSPPTEPSRPLPDWAEIHKELGRRSVTLRLLWQEYRERLPNGYGYTQFCEYYHRWAETLEPVMRHHHAPGEKMFVDWAGQTVPIHEAGGVVAEASLFIAVLGASNKTFAEAFSDQKLPSWITAHCHAYAYFGGVAQVIVPDNPKTGVIKPCRYEPLLHRTYQEMAEHYGAVVIPARPRRPRDKAKVEGGVLIAERQILAALRDRTFFDVVGVNAAIQPLLARLNAQPFQKLDGSRDSWFEMYEKPELLPLPATTFELATWTKATVNIDYHAVVDKHGYSVPYQLIHQTLDVRLSASTVELFHNGKRVAAHRRSSQAGKFTTLNEHRPKSHQKHLEWTPGRIVEWAQKTGPCCAELVRQIMESRPHPLDATVYSRSSDGSRRCASPCHPISLVIAMPTLTPFQCSCVRRCDDGSFRLNGEATLNICDAAFAAAQVKVFEEDTGKSPHIDTGAVQEPVRHRKTVRRGCGQVAVATMMAIAASMRRP